ncbi:MAG: biotin--[acetyl-CoA-carboxylase] ligase [Acidobacteria bacterium]|nr:MAG: biotin--[acetyl-CoA-carboxylase] ligase [Acidobacteriota bacterium]
MKDEQTSEALTPASLQRHLRSAVFGHRIFYYPTIGSTNDRALDLATAGEPEGALVLAEDQTGGRGRRQRTWESRASLGIYVSLVLRPGVPAIQAPLFTFTAAVAVADALRETCHLPGGIKWPNDVVVGRRKVAGILGETRGSEPRIREMVIGIGVNVNHSVCADRAPILASILEGFERRYARVLAGKPADLLREWEALSALPRGRRVAVEGPHGRCEGTVAGVDDEGALLLDTPGGGTTRVPFGEIVEAL